MTTAQDILNEVTGSNQKIGAVLAGNGGYSPLSSAGNSGPSVTLDIPQGFFSPNNGAGLFGSAKGLLPGFSDAKPASDTSLLSSAGKFLDFITDIPRVVTLFLGVVLIIVGLFALNNKSVIEAVKSAVV